MQVSITLIKEVLLLAMYKTTTPKTAEMIRSDHRFNLQTTNIQNEKKIFLKLPKF